MRDFNVPQAPEEDDWSFGNSAQAAEPDFHRPEYHRPEYQRPEYLDELSADMEFEALQLMSQEDEWEPEEADDTLQIDFTPSIKQREALDFLYDRKTVQVVYGGAVGVGKTELGCAWVITQAMRYPGTRWMICRETYTGLRDTTMKTFDGLCAKWGLVKGVHYKERSVGSTAQMVLPGGSEVLFRHVQYKPSDADFHSLGSYELTGIFVDECVQIREKAWTKLIERIRYRNAELGLTPKILGTCNPRPNWVLDKFYRPWKDGKMPDDMAFVRALPEDSWLPKAYYDRLRRTFTHAQVLSLIEGQWEFSDGELQLFKADWRNDIFDVPYDRIQALRTGTHYITADVARFGKDKTVALVWDGMVVVDAYVGQQQDEVAVGQKLVELAKRYKVKPHNVIVDVVGLGAGPVGILKTQYGPPTEFNGANAAIMRATQKTPYQNMRSQCYYMLSEVQLAILPEVAKRRVGDLTLRELIYAELVAIEERPGAKLRVNSKDEQKAILGRSPDFADALSMRMQPEAKPSGGFYGKNR